jgi:hypothetical protein
MAEKRTKMEKALRQGERLKEEAETGLEEIATDRRQGAIRSGEERRKVNIPPPPGSPVRSGADRRALDRRSKRRP